MTPVSTSRRTAPLNSAWATIDGPIRRNSAAAVPNASPTPVSTITRPALPAPRIGSTWATPNSTACTAMALGHDSRLRSDRRTTPRKTISSTIGAAITAVTTIATT